MGRINFVLSIEKTNEEFLKYKEMVSELYKS